MITLNVPGSINGSTNQPITEGWVKDTADDVKDAAVDYAGRGQADGGLGVPVAKIKDDWNNSDGVGKATVAADTTGVVADELDKKVSDIEKINRVDNRSIVARARNSVKQCPIYITQSIRAAEAHLISKQFEKVYVTFFQAAISQNPIISPDEANNLGFLNKFHTDIRESAMKLIESYDPIDEFDSMMMDSIYSEYQLSENCKVQFSVISTNDPDCKTIIAENARLMNEPLTGLPYLYYEANRYADQINRDHGTLEGKPYRDANGNLNWKYELDDEGRRLNSEEDSNNFKDTHDKTTMDRVDVVQVNIDEIKKMARTARMNTKDFIDAIKAGKFKNDKAMGYLQYHVIDRDAGTGMFVKKNVTSESRISPKREPDPILNPTPEILKQSDLKKINGMEPYMMKATFIIRDPETKTNQQVSYLIGIKSVMHLIHVQDLADELYELVTGNVKSLQKVRYKTGEIGFADYMFNIKGLKADAAKKINHNKRWLSTLKELANYNKTNGSLLKKPAELLLNGNVPIPNATLILSQTDVTWLVGKTGIDLSQISNARKLAKNLFLIAIAIVDPSAGSMRILFDGDVDWDVQSLASIDAEVAKTDNSNLLRELQRAVNK